MSEQNALSSRLDMPLFTNVCFPSARRNTASLHFSNSLQLLITTWLALAKNTQKKWWVLLPTWLSLISPTRWLWEYVLMRHVCTSEPTRMLSQLLRNGCLESHLDWQLCKQEISIWSCGYPTYPDQHPVLVILNGYKNKMKYNTAKAWIASISKPAVLL